MDCSEYVDELNADPDIVGPGVLAAFFITAVLTIAAVLLAYFSETLDDSFMRELDRKIITSARRKLRHLNRVHTNLSHDTEGESEALKEARKEALTQFILALSDQQLVTGLAILIAGVSDPKHITGYEFTVVLALAWFSSTTHLTTLAALRSYMQSHGIVRNARVVGMVCVLILLAYALFLSVSLAGKTYPVQCVYDGLEGSGTGGVPLLVVLEVVATVMVLFMLIAGYAMRIQDLYLREANPALLPILLFWKMSRHDTGGLTYLEYFAEIVSARRLSRLLKIPDAGELTKRSISLDLQYRDSFLSTLPGIAFSFSYGICQIAVYRWITAPQLTPDSNRMNFGQLVPLLLLVLPLLAAGETYNDYRNQRRKEMSLRKAQSSTDSVSSSDEHSKNFVNAAAKFDDRVDDVGRYFRREIRLRILSYADEDETELLRRKSDLLVRYEKVIAFERDFDTTPALVLFWVDLFLSGLMGVLLNVGLMVPLSVVGATIFAGIWTFRLVTVGFDIQSIIRESMGRFREITKK